MRNDMIIKFKLSGDFATVQEGCKLISKKLGICFQDDGILLCVKWNPDRLIIDKTDDGYVISCSDTTEFFRALAILTNCIKENRDCVVFEKKRFKTCGVMFDLSRSAVYKVETVYDIIEYMAVMGLNMLMLYTEDVYEMKKYPDFGYLRGAYSADEIRAMDSYAQNFGIELIPCIQALGHLRAALRWPSLSKFADNGDVLMTGDGEESYEFIEEMFKTCASCFTSRSIHIGFDEAYGLGRGKYLIKNGYRELSDVYFEHLQKVCDIAKKYGFVPMIWNDMIFKLDGSQRFLIEEPEKMQVSEANYRRYPEDLQLVYYNYGGSYRCDDVKVTDYLLNYHQKFNRYVHFGGGIWTWTRLIPGLKKTYDVTVHHLNACQRFGIQSVFACVWGCGQHQFDVRTTLPGMQIWAELLYHADADMDFIWQRFHQCTGFNQDAWKTLYFDDFSDEDMQKYHDPASYCINPSYQHLYNDILTGMLDKTLSGYNFKPRYKAFSDAIKLADIREEKSLFDRYLALYELLYVKCDLGIRLRSAYKSKNKDEIKNILIDIEKLPALLAKYHQCVENDWYSQYKPFGYSGQDMSLGMIEARVNTAIRVIKKYLSGEYESLPELECDIEYYLGNDKPLTEVAFSMNFMSSSVFEINM